MFEDTRLIDLGFVNAYLVRAGDGYILIDTGVAMQWARLESELLQIGALPGKIKLVIITHGDGDHTGNCAVLQRKYGLKIGMHAGDERMVMTGTRLKRHARSMLGNLFLWFGERMGRKFDCFQPDIALEDGQDLAGYGFAAKIIHTPGHTPGSIAILTEDGQLFAGDTLANRSKPESAWFIENEQELLESLAKLKQTKARIIYPGHGRPFSGEVLMSIMS